MKRLLWVVLILGWAFLAHAKRWKSVKRAMPILQRDWFDKQKPIRRDRWRNTANISPAVLAHPVLIVTMSRI